MRGLDERAVAQIAQLLWIFMGEFDELKPVGPGGVGFADRGFGCVVGEGAHVNVSCCLRKDSAGDVQWVRVFETRGQ